MASDNFEEIEKRITTEKKRLSTLYSKIEPRKRKTVVGLIERAAFMRITLDDMERNLNIFGFTEMFSQGEQEPYERKRPTADLYNSLNSNYQKIIKQLTDLLPKEEPAPKSDGFDDFVNGRGDV